MKTSEERLADLGFSSPLLISGPCSAETEEQLLETAHQLVTHVSQTQVFRAGLWKPRTRPGSFEGIGEVGLPWLQRVKQETGMLTAVEVANQKHVELSLKAGVDILWIGARSTVSPFIVQEIADALQGTDTTVLIKNPVSPDLSLWLGAVERIENAGIRKIMMVHRGFSSYIKTKYRNNPEWQIALNLQQLRPDLPLLLDPSHMGGKRELLFDLCQTAYDLKYDGLMVESHITPHTAWSDAEQQLTPQALGEMLRQLKQKRSVVDQQEFQTTLTALRTQIDEIDAQLFISLGNRMKIAEKIGHLKQLNQVSIIQTERWNEVLQQMKQVAVKQGLNESFVEEIFKAIHQESIEHQAKFYKKQPINR